VESSRKRDFLMQPAAFDMLDEALGSGTDRINSGAQDSLHACEEIYITNPPAWYNQVIFELLTSSAPHLNYIYGVQPFIE